MKKLLILLVLMSNLLFGQDTTQRKAKEYYLTFSDFSPLNIQLKYKKQIGKKTYLKFGLINLSANFNKRTPVSSISFPLVKSNYSCGLLFGIEFRKILSSKFSLFHGPNISYTYQKNVEKTLSPLIPISNQKEITEIHIGSIPYSIGLIINLTTNILLSAEINPSISFTSNNYIGQNPNLKYNTTGLGFSLDNRLALLSIVYRL